MQQRREGELLVRSLENTILHWADYTSGRSSMQATSSPISTPGSKARWMDAAGGHGRNGLNGVDPWTYVSSIYQRWFFLLTSRVVTELRDPMPANASSFLSAPVLAGQRTAWRRDAAQARGAPVHVLVDGVAVPAHEGECLATALAVAGMAVLRHSPNEGGARGVFCLMGSCQECVVHVDGAPVVACMEPVRAGMQVSLDRFVRERLSTGDRD